MPTAFPTRGFSRRATALVAVGGVTLAVALAAPATAAIVDEPITVSSDDPTLSLAPLGTYESGVFDESAAEIVAFHDDKVYVVNALAGAVDVLDASDPTAPVKLYTISGDGVANSIAIRPDGLGIVALENTEKTEPGSLFFFDADAETPTALGTVTVGALPDMVTVTKDGAYALVANEAEPADDFSRDPEGSVGVVALPSTVAAPAQSDVRIADFHAFEEGGAKTLDPAIRVFGPQPEADFPVSRNLEPEYITVDGGTAYATLQEANGVAVIDIATATVTDIWSLGFKDHGVEGNGLDASDKDGAIDIRTFPGLLGIYMPDAIASYEASDGSTYLVTANEGDAREWGDYVEPARAKSLAKDGLGPVCDDNPLAGLLGDADLGRLNVTTASGFDEARGCYSQLYSFGGRSFSIWTTDGAQVWDSGDRFERIIAEAAPEFFNSNHSESNFEGRSDDKGPEAESVALGEIGGRTYAFVGFERVGGIAVFDITEPAGTSFITYINNRDFAVSVEDADDPSAVLSSAGDLGPEGIAFIAADASPTGEPLLAGGNEVSGTTTLFEITDLTASSDPVLISAPVISGTPEVGARLSATTGEWEGENLTYGYQWLRNGSDIAGADGATYTVKSTDQGKEIAVVVTATSGESATYTASAPVTVRAQALAYAVSSPLLGTTKTSFTITVSVKAAAGVSANGPVSITVGGKTYPGTLTDGTAKIAIDKQKRGLRAIVVSVPVSETVSATTGLGLILVR